MPNSLKLDLMDTPNAVAFCPPFRCRAECGQVVDFIGNTILYPEKWIFRVLQETTAEGFNPCRNVLVRDNRIIFRRAQVQIEINIGSGTDPKSFMFEGNQWFAEDYPESSKPRLPNEEKKGVYGMDPRRK